MKLEGYVVPIEDEKCIYKYGWNTQEKICGRPRRNRDIVLNFNLEKKGVDKI
jgi:hypothetical protein